MWKFRVKVSVHLSFWVVILLYNLAYFIILEYLKIMIQTSTDVFAVFSFIVPGKCQGGEICKVRVPPDKDNPAAPLWDRPGLSNQRNLVARWGQGPVFGLDVWDADQGGCHWAPFFSAPPHRSFTEGMHGKMQGNPWPIFQFLCISTSEKWATPNSNTNFILNL